MGGGIGFGGFRGTSGSKKYQQYNERLGNNNSKFLTDKLGKIAKITGKSIKEVRKAIENVKKQPGWRNGTNNRNPDVMVDTKTGEVYPKNPDGTLGDSIGNIFDYLF